MNCSEKILEILDFHNINGHDKPGGTDKNTNHSYVDVYGKILAPHMGRNGNLLEIGAQYGGSILLWHELLDKFKILSIDTKDQIDPLIKSKLSYNKFTLIVDDAYKKSTVDQCVNLHPGGFEIIIDDGPHTIDSQLSSIDLYLNLLKPNGVFVIEDIQDFSFVDLIKQKIPSSDVYEYHVEVHDLRNVKQRYDDVIITITKKIKPAENRIAVFYHLGQFYRDWETDRKSVV